MAKRPPNFRRSGAPKPRSGWNKTSRLPRARRGYGWAWEKLRLVILERDRWLCQHCIKQGRSEIATDVDHITPKYQGGGDDPDNLQSLCKSCHRAKTEREGNGSQRQYGEIRWNTHPNGLKPSLIPCTIICGPPAAGKSTYVRKCAGSDDLVICFDQIATSIFRANGGQGRRLPHRLHASLSDQQKARVFSIRNEMMINLSDNAFAARYKKAWIILSEPSATRRAWWSAKLGANIVVLKPAEKTCIDRARRDAAKGDARDPAIQSIISRWFQRYEPWHGDVLLG